MLFLVESLYPRARLSATELRKLLPEAAIFIGEGPLGFHWFHREGWGPRCRVQLPKQVAEFYGLW